MHLVVKNNNKRRLDSFIIMFFGATLVHFSLAIDCVLGQENSQESQEQIDPNLESPLAITIETLQTSKVITAPLSVIITIENRTDKAFKIEEIALKPPNSLRLIRQYDDSISCLAQKLEPNGSIRCIKEIQEVGLWQELSTFRTLLFVPGEYSLITFIKYREDIPNKPLRVEYRTQNINLEPPLSALLRGGVMGAFLLAIFRISYSWRNVKLGGGKERTLQKGSLTMIVDGFAIFCSGSIVSIVTILMTRRLSNLNLPISLHVEDFLGGAVIGLLSVPLGDFLFSKFVKKTSVEERQIAPEIGVGEPDLE